MRSRQTPSRSTSSPYLPHTVRGANGIVDERDRGTAKATSGTGSVGRTSGKAKRHSLLPSFFKSASSPVRSPQASPRSGSRALEASGLKMATSSREDDVRRQQPVTPGKARDEPPHSIPLQSPNRSRSGSVKHSAPGVETDEPGDAEMQTSADTERGHLPSSENGSSDPGLEKEILLPLEPATVLAALTAINQPSVGESVKESEGDNGHESTTARDHEAPALTRVPSYPSQSRTAAAAAIESSSLGEEQRGVGLGLPELQVDGPSTPRKMRPRPASVIFSSPRADASESRADRGAEEDEAEEELTPRTSKRSKRLSMLEFLRTEPPSPQGQPPVASGKSLQAPKSAPLVPSTNSLYPQSSGASTPPVRGSLPSSAHGSAELLPGVQSGMSVKAGKQKQVDLDERAASRAASPLPGWNVSLSVQPLSDAVVMFGSSQTTAKYSLSGTVVLTIPRPRRTASTGHGRSRSTAASQTAPVTSSSHRHNASLSKVLPAGQVDSPAPSITLTESNGEAEHHEEIHVKSLTITFTGYSIYFDPAGRFSGLKLADVTQELLPEGAIIPVTFDPDSLNPLKYETEFDISIPGCLPPSVQTPFGATFYCLSSAARYFDSAEAAKGAALVTTPSGMLSFGQGVSIAPPLRSSSATSSLDHGDITPSDSAQQSGKGSGAEGKPKTKPTWLSKIQRSTRPDSASDSSSAERPHKQQQVKKRKTRPTPVTTDGSIIVESPIAAVIVQRCRDVVPVPVARMAHGEMEGIPTDPPPTPRGRRVPPRVSSNSDLSASRSAASQSGMPHPRQGNEEEEAMETLAAEVPPAMPTLDTDAHAPNRDALAPVGGNDAKRPVLYGRRSSLTDRAASNLPSNFETTRSGSSSSTTQPMRHFLHRPVLHPPAEAGCGDAGLPFMLTVSVPTHVHTSGTGTDALTFGIQVDLSNDAGWNKVRALGGLRLRHMELVCSQSERHR